ncbi:hypothetical protein Droror1_Dr00006934 [Drosera rotundifolia]
MSGRGRDVGEPFAWWPRPGSCLASLGPGTALFSLGPGSWPHAGHQPNAQAGRAQARQAGQPSLLCMPSSKLKACFKWEDEELEFANIKCGLEFAVTMKMRSVLEFAVRWVVE